LDSCNPKPFKLDTSYELYNKSINIEADTPVLNYKRVSLHMRFGIGNLGHAVLRKANNYFLALLVDSGNYIKIRAIREIDNRPKENQEFVHYCNSSCEAYYKPFALVEEIGKHKLKTIKVWAINSKTRTIDVINPSAVDCRSNYYAAY
jgi:hypothetical protein